MDVAGRIPARGMEGRSVMKAMFMVMVEPSPAILVRGEGGAGPLPLPKETMDGDESYEAKVAAAIMSWLVMGYDAYEKFKEVVRFAMKSTRESGITEWSITSDDIDEWVVLGMKPTRT